MIVNCHLGDLLNEKAISHAHLPASAWLTACCVQNHTFQAEVGAVFQALQPRLAITTHLTPNSYVYIPLVSGIRSQYPTGPLAIATDFDVWDITTTSVRQRRLLPLEETSGYSVGVPNGQDLATSNLATIARPEVVAGNLRVFQLPTDAEGVNAAG